MTGDTNIDRGAKLLDRAMTIGTAALEVAGRTIEQNVKLNAEAVRMCARMAQAEALIEEILECYATGPEWRERARAFLDDDTAPDGRRNDT